MGKTAAVGIVLFLSLLSVSSASVLYDYSTTAGLTEADICGAITIANTLSFSLPGGNVDCFVTSREIYKGNFMLQWEFTPTGVVTGSYCSGYWFTGVAKTGGAGITSITPVLGVSYDDCSGVRLSLRTDGMTQTEFSPPLTLGTTYRITLERTGGQARYSVETLGGTPVFTSANVPLASTPTYDTTVHITNPYRPIWFSGPSNQLSGVIDNLFSDITLRTISGTVRDSVSGSPIQGAGVSLPVAELSLSRATDSSGAYSFQVPPDVYTLTASASGYQTKTQTADVRTGDQTGVDFALTPTSVSTVTYDYTLGGAGDPDSDNLQETDPCGEISIDSGGSGTLAYGLRGGIPHCYVVSRAETYDRDFKLEWEITPTSFSVGPLCAGYWGMGVWQTGGGAPTLGQNYIKMGMHNCFAVSLFIQVQDGPTLKGGHFTPPLTLGNTYIARLERVGNLARMTVFDKATSSLFFASPDIVLSTPVATYDTTAHLTNDMYITGFWAGQYNYLSGSVDSLKVTRVLANTPAGTNVQVDVGSGVAATFSQVTTAGDTTVTLQSTGPAPPTGLEIVGLKGYYDITTTATYSGTVTVCITYDPAQLPKGRKESDIRLRQYDGSKWVDITNAGYPDLVNHVVCGTTNSLSFFALMVPELVAANVNIDPDTLNLKSRGQFVTAYIEIPGQDVRQVDVTTVELIAPGGSVPAVADPKYGFVKSPEVKDRDGDGLPELMVKFDLVGVQSRVLLGPVSLQVNGLVGALRFEGTDTIRVI